MKGQAIYFVFVFLYYLNCVGGNSKNNNKRTSYFKKKETLKNFDNIVLDDFYSALDSQDNNENKLKKNEGDFIGQGIFSLISKKNHEKEKSLKGESEVDTKLQVTKVQGAQCDQAVEP
ncbi:hypothetical protein PFHG_05608 [Plasmodium falciparum HB3]|uniref:Uncharacterized protein n=1 Tax=Plasmodium falciparum (isolate HB3) TaxID=137071 RepID=A0A0L7KMH6_PLAFX|nr:hypothetical protein PFHG_05608 [Plasmodium falciparum HB3]